jgi:hypothetical protein
MLSDKQRRTALKKNIAHARDMGRRLLADGVEEITLTYYADEGSFRAMKLPEEGDDFEHSVLVERIHGRSPAGHDDPGARSPL